MSSIDKVCMVCGDKSLGYNFNAVTCESCKAFFRRNALSSKDFACPFSGTCEITIVTRRFCQRCRLEKCFQIGMQKEYIMSEEDKLMKRKKIEQNRAKKKLKNEIETKTTTKTIKKEIDLTTNSDQWNYDHEKYYDEVYSHSDQSSNSSIKQTNVTSSAMSPEQPSTASFSLMSIQTYPKSPLPPVASVSSSTYDTSNNDLNATEKFHSNLHRFIYPTKESSASEIVNFLLEHPKESDAFINVLMQNQTDALEIISKIIHSQKDAMRFIGHFIGAPGDALKIIAKIMNSPINALNLFTKFMCSPTDSLELIAKCVNSPSEVLNFVQEIMHSPDNAMNSLNKFLSSPAEAMKMLSDMVNTSFADSTTKLEPIPVMIDENEINDRGFMIKHLIESLKYDTPAETIRKDTNEIKLKQQNSIETVISDAVNMEYNLNNCEENLNRELNDAETAKLNELIVAYKALCIPLEEDISPLVSYQNDVNDKTEKNPQDPHLLTLINLTAIAVRRMIKMVKKINAFRNLCQEDQVALLKGGCTEMMILRSMMQYDIDRSIWTIPRSQEIMSSIKSDILKLASNNVYEEYENFIRTFDARLRKDENIILILSAIVLFTSSRTKIIHTDVISLEQNSYYYLLRRYLESVYAGCEAKSIFLKLIQKINDLQRLKDVIIAVYLDVNPNHIEPLLREIFDIKNC